jgi:hypothetical protein
MELPLRIRAPVVARRRADRRGLRAVGACVLALVCGWIDRAPNTDYVHHARAHSHTNMGAQALERTQRAIKSAAGASA